MTERVLLVDDEKKFLDAMGARMKARGMDVSTSESAEEALEMLAKEAYDAVILDLRMPEMDGIEALKRMKEKRPEVQVILLTGHATVEEGVEAIKLGAMDFLEKPADLDAISEKIKKAKEKKMLIVNEMDHDKFIDVLKRYGI